MNTKDALKAFIGLSRTYHMASEITRKDVKQYGLSIKEFATLELIYHKGYQPIQVIGEKILLTSGSMTYVVDQLVKKGWLKRVICEEDRRIVYADLTEEGRKLIETIFPNHEGCIAQIFSSLSEEELENFIQTLKKISNKQ